jgi:hypothetical protein
MRLPNDQCTCGNANAAKKQNKHAINLSGFNSVLTTVIFRPLMFVFQFLFETTVAATSPQIWWISEQITCLIITSSCFSEKVIFIVQIDPKMKSVFNSNRTKNCINYRFEFSSEYICLLSFADFSILSSMICVKLSNFMYFNSLIGVPGEWVFPGT